ncbi:glycosyltransferase [Streptomyces sp. NPDC093093]|uniref:glycosyltransferase n=1 Tax=Streptomyces sp. NPDC093093 TaxID=3366025 RepID=UPI0038131834
MRPSPPQRPALRILLATWGTTGDIAPYTGLALGLRDAGHHVTIVTSTRYAPHFTVHGLPVREMPLAHQDDLMTQPVPRWASMRNGHDVAAAAAPALLEAAAEGADIILAHPLLHPFCALIGEGLRLPCIGVYTVAHAMMLPRMMKATPWKQHLIADTAVKLFLSPMYVSSLKRLRHSLGLPQRRLDDIVRTLHGQPVCYGISNALLPHDYPMPQGHTGTGYWSPARPPQWKPDARIVDFLEAGPAPVYFGFGSMHRLDRNRLSETIVRATRKLRVRAIIQTGWANLSSDADEVLTIAECPHDWLFPRVRAAVHHAGPGTTHASLRAATPTLPAPVTWDQPYWAARLTALGLAPTAIPARRLNTDNLTQALRMTLDQTPYRDKTRRLSHRLSDECGTAGVLRVVDQTMQRARH